MSVRWLCVIALMCSPGCGDDGAPVADAATAPQADATPRPLVEVPATDGPLDLDFNVAITGEGQNRVGSVSILNSRGAVEIRGTSFDVVTYEMQPWDSFGLTLFQTLAVNQEEWYVIWFYCEDNVLTGIYSEGVHGDAIAYEAATGTCSFGSTPTRVQVQLPATSMLGPRPERGFSFSGGTELSLAEGGYGLVQLGSQQLTIMPFERVDCLATCGDPGWWELHAILYDAANQRACFGIFYMFPDRPNDVVLTYSLTLPDLTDPVGYRTFTANWSAP